MEEPKLKGKKEKERRREENNIRNKNTGIKENTVCVCDMKKKRR